MMLKPETPAEAGDVKWAFNYVEKDGILFVKLLNTVDFENVRKLCEEINSLARKNDIRRYFIDHRGVEIVMSVLDIDKIPDMLRNIKFNYDGNVAVVLDSSTPKINLFTFLKNVLNLASMHFEIFYDRDEAITWLKAI